MAEERSVDRDDGISRGICDRHGVVVAVGGRCGIQGLGINAHVRWSSNTARVVIDPPL